ncbi:MAG: hypothetical protein WDW36_002078 [Sanguina aurantia]
MSLPKCNHRGQGEAGQAVESEASGTNLAGIGYGTAVGAALAGAAALALGGPAILSATAVGAVVGAVAGGAVEKEAERGVELDRVVEFDSGTTPDAQNQGVEPPAQRSPTETYDFRGDGHGEVHAGGASSV